MTEPTNPSPRPAPGGRAPDDRIDDFRLGFALRVRWAEVDMQRVVFNAHYLAYFDIAVTEYWRALAAGDQAWMAATVDQVYVVRSVLDWFGSARFDDQLVVHARCQQIGRSSFTLRLLVVRDGTILVAGETVYVHAPAGRSSPLPASLIDRILAFERRPPERPQIRNA